MKKQWLSIMIAVFFACCALVQSQSVPNALQLFDQNPPRNAGGGMNYHGGPVFETEPSVYIVWYGDWTAKDRGIIDYYFAHLGGSTQDEINSTYSDSRNKFVPNKVKHSAQNDYHDDYSLGKSLSGDGEIQQIVANAISGGHLPGDSNGVYFVLTYTDVTDPGFCSQFCGYHGPTTSIVSGKIIKYAMVGNPDQCKSSCETSYILGDKGSPNHDPGADGTTAIMWDEFSDTMSDPEVGLDTAWEGNFCGEASNCCAWLFGKVKKDSHGHFYTNVIGGKEYAMQEMLQLLSKSRHGNVPAACKNVF